MSDRPPPPPPVAGSILVNGSFQLKTLSPPPANLADTTSTLHTSNTRAAQLLREFLTVPTHRF